MGRGRLEAFSDGVLAIIITIMVLELKVPHGENWADLTELFPQFISYILSFIYIGIYWNNHHHLLHTIDHVSAGILWANLHLLFWLSLLPFNTGWIGENHFAALPMAVYSFNLLMAALAYQILEIQIIKSHGKESMLAKAIGTNIKERLSLAAYASAIPLALLDYTWLSGVLLIGVALMWLVPDRRIEKKIGDKK